MDSWDTLEDELSPLHGPARAVNANIQELLALFEAHADQSQVLRKGQEWREKVNATRSKLISSVRKGQKQAKRKFQEKSVEFRLNIKKQLRSVFTGDPNRSFRRHIQEPPQIKFIDKACFTVSIIHVILTELFFIKFQQYFVNYYACMLILLLLTRYIDYKSKQYHYFLLDFCYFVNFLTLLHGYVCPANQLFFEALFVLANGPVLIAIVVWRNSMVFHSVDKMTSLFIHMFPPLYTFLVHWELSGASDGSPHLSLMSWFVYPTILYFVWQFGYLIKTEFIDAEHLRSHPDIATSLRWLSNDDKNFMNKLTVKYCRKLGIMSNDEKFDASQWKTKFIFVFVNFVYYLATLSFVKILFEYKKAHLVCMLATLLSSIFNGANYYIEVFSERYNESLKQKQVKLNEKYLYIDERLDEILKKKFKEIEREFDQGVRRDSLNEPDALVRKGSAASDVSDVSRASDISVSYDDAATADDDDVAADMKEAPVTAEDKELGKDENVGKGGKDGKNQHREQQT